MGRSREESFKTLRELPLFGYNKEPVDFRHPKIEDLQAMPKDKPIQAVGFKWKENKNNGGNNGGNIGGIQVMYSNGCNSPVLLGKNQTADDLKEIKITTEVKKIRGSENGNIIRVSNIHF